MPFKLSLKCQISNSKSNKWRIRRIIHSTAEHKGEQLSETYMKGEIYPDNKLEETLL